MSVDTLSAMESGHDTRPRLGIVENLAAAFNLSIGAFLLRLDDTDDTPRARTVREITKIGGRLDNRAVELVRGHAALVVKSVLRGL